MKIGRLKKEGKVVEELKKVQIDDERKYAGRISHSLVNELQLLLGLGKFLTLHNKSYQVAVARLLK